MKKLSRKNHTIISKGGLGNQLFIYYFYLYIKNKFPDDNVILETRTYFWFDYKYNAKFKLENLGLVYKKSSFLRSIIFIFDFLAINIISKTKLNNFCKNKIFIDDKNLNNLDNFYKDKNKFIYNGYFQDYRIIDLVYNLNKISFTNYKPLIKYKKLENKITNYNLNIAFCIRNFNTVRGSESRYSYSKDKINALIDVLIKKYQTPKFYIFAFNNILINDFIFPTDSEYITHENGYVDDKAILKIISMCNIKVITNSSSFYWIAAYISKKSNSKIYISENYSIKNNLVHPNWIKF